MDNLYQNINQICHLNQLCQDKSCTKMHPRCFTGICILHLQKQQHDETICKSWLKPNSLKDIKQVLKNPINGVFLINLCPQSEQCPNQKNCGFLHRDWFDQMRLCFDYLNDNCEEGNSCKRTHKEWDELKTQINEKFQYLSLDPERLCLVKDCKCQNHNNQLQGLCLENFKGICSTLGQCSKIHEDWEKVRSVNVQQFANKKVVPCTCRNEGDVKKLDTKFWSNLEMLHNKQFLLKIKEQVKQKNVIDILFLMDCTYSMDQWIESAKNNVQDIISSFQKSVQQILIRVAFIGYRDFCDNELKIEYHDFTNNVDSVKSFISSLKAEGGGDTAEDISGALELALKLDFSKHPDSILCTYLVCDAPTHGRQYHDIDSDEDDLIDQIPENQLEGIMQRLQQLKKFNYFFCCKITSDTDKMFNIMKNQFKDLEISECSNIHKFPDLVKFTLLTSYKKSQINSQPKLEQKVRIRANFVKHKPFIGIQKNGKGLVYNFLSNMMVELGKNQVAGETILEIDLNPFKGQNYEEGQTALIFQVFDLRNNRNLVAKLPKEIFENQNKKEQNKSLIQEAERSVNVRYLQTMIAKQLACEFRNDTKKSQYALPIFYATPIKYELLDEFYGVKQLYAETDINLDMKWEKISNNTSFLDKDKKIYGTFSHYTHFITDGALIITDLQGKGGILSDPSIHTTGEGLGAALQDSTNNKEEGILQFSEYQHKRCNQLCQQLKLGREKFKSDETDNESTHSGILKTNQNFDEISEFQIQKVNCVCDLCSEIYTLEYKQYQENNQYYFHCQKCSEVVERSEICKCCGNEFKYNQVQMIRLGCTPDKCDNCQKSCNNLLNKCFYCETKCFNRELKQITIGTTKNYICKQGQQFFESIYCGDCKEPFSYQQWPTLQEYSSQKYACYSCKKKIE